MTGEAINVKRDWTSHLIFFCLLLLVFSLTIYLVHKNNESILPNLNLSIFTLPPKIEIIQNTKLMLHGYSNGYMRTILGIIYFMMMSSFFVFSGKILINWIFKKKNQTANDLINITLLERLSLYYISGALIASLLWFGLGVAGLLKSALAWTIALSGCIGLFYQIISSDWIKPSVCKQRLFPFLVGFSSTEILLSIFLFISILLLSLRLYALMFGDTLQIMAALPNAYINEGKLFFTPNHYYTYFTQNFEMLVMWSFLLKSEFAAGLIVWGIFITLIMLIFGFFTRYFSYGTGLITIFVLLSAPVTIGSLHIRADTHAAVFLFAHYVALIESCNKRSKSWAILSGLLCGGAIGYKLVALPAALFSFLILLGWDLYHRFKSDSRVYLSIFWVFGCIPAVAPWFIRTAIETGDPIYPFLSNLLKIKISDPIYRDFTTKSFSYNMNGMRGVVDYLCYLLLNKQVNFTVIEYYGPTLLFSLLGIYVLFSRSFMIGFKLSILSALLSLVFSIHWLDARYFLGPLIFIVCCPFGLIWNRTIEQFDIKFFKSLVLWVIFYCFIQMTAVNFWPSSLILLNVILSGNSMGNYISDYYLDDDMRWIHYVINTKSEDNGTLMYIGLYYTYGLRGRKIIFCSGYENLSREPICEIAKNSADSSELYSRLISMGVKHILISSTFLNDVKNQSKMGVEMSDNDIQKIRDFLQKNTILRFATPDRKVLWLSLKTGIPLRPILLTKDDAREFPIYFLKEADTLFSNGNAQLAKAMMLDAIHAPMKESNKFLAYTFLSQIYMSLGDRSNYDHILSERTTLFPNETY